GAVARAEQQQITFADSAVAIEIGRGVELGVVAAEDGGKETHVIGGIGVVEIEVAEACAIRAGYVVSGKALDIVVAGHLIGDDSGDVVAAGEVGGILGPQVAVEAIGLAVGADHGEDLRIG